MAKSSSLSKTAVWILLGLLILGLAGFGATNLGGNLRSIGTVGDLPVSAQSYALAMQRELRAIQAQTGQPVNFAQAREAGLDQQVLQRLITTRALDHETAELGISVGDANVRDQVLSIPNFQGLDGSFDREAYRFALQNQGLSEADFETQLREESARNLVQTAVVNGLTMPPALAEALVAFSAERRSFTWSALDAALLASVPDAPTDFEVRAFYEENIASFTLPVTKRITYAWLTPEMLVDSVEVNEDAFVQAYEDRIDEFVQPERRLVERLVYLDAEQANTAAAALEVGGTSFERLVEERGLSLQDVDLGDVSRLELDAAGEAVFTAEVGDVIGPLPSALGPALFRVNAILPAQSTSLDAARPFLREAIALDRARRVIDAQADTLDDLLAGGATLENLVAESDMQLGQIDWNDFSSSDIAAYEDFRSAAAEVTLEDFPAISGLDDGGLFAMRLEEILPQRPEPFEDAFDAAKAALEDVRLEAALEAYAESQLATLIEGASFEQIGLTALTETDVTRDGFVPGTPPGFLPALFDMEPGAVQVIAEAGIVALVRLDAVAPPADTDQTEALRRNLQTALDQALAQDVFNVFTQDVGVRANPQIDQRAVDAVNVNFQ